jgi:hypothetical protein
MPADRPFELGHHDFTSPAVMREGTVAISRQPIAPLAGTKFAATSRTVTTPAPGVADSNQWERSFADRFAPAGNLPVAPNARVTISAFAAAPPSNGAIITGRGLY